MSLLHSSRRCFIWSMLQAQHSTAHQQFNFIQFEKYKSSRSKRISSRIVWSVPFKLPCVCAYFCMFEHTFLWMFFECNSESNEYYNKGKEVRNIQSEHVLFFFILHAVPYFKVFSFQASRTHRIHSTQIIYFTLNYAN